MEFSDFQSRVKAILAREVPGIKQVAGQGKSIVSEVRIGRASYMEKFGVSSEREFKEICIKEKRISFHAHIGLNSWRGTQKALSLLHSEGLGRGFTVDRAGLCLDRRMGLPSSMRDQAIAETGPMLDSKQAWKNVGQGPPIVPHMGDFMIGFPASLENTVNALEAGVTTIGNLSQYFSHEVPGWKNTAHTALRTVQAIDLMGRLRNKGTLVHSYLEDGFGALFYDCTTIAGWALLEKYIVETLLGAKLSHCIGGLTSDPVKRAGWIFALDQIHDHECVGSMFYGDTISFTRDLSMNSGLVSEYLLWDILAQMKCPTGHAVLPLPLTEGVRIPSVEEIIEAQVMGKRIEKTAHRLIPHVDFTASRAFAKKMVTQGKKVFDQAMDGLSQAGVDTRNPVELLIVLKKIGAPVFEEMFGAGEKDDSSIRKRIPVLKTDMFELSEKNVARHRDLFLSAENKDKLNGLNVLIASTDVHEHAIMVLSQLCREAGSNILYLGAEKNPDDIAEAAKKNQVDTIFLSTHNGMALEYAKELKDELKLRKCYLPVVMGGVLNQKTDSCELPVDVSQDLKELGFLPYGVPGIGADADTDLARFLPDPPASLT